MIKSFNPIFTTLILLGGSFLILAIPSWMAYILLTAIAVIFMVNLIYKNNDIILLIWHFCAEFIGFCLLVTLFVGTVVLMNGLIPA